MERQTATGVAAGITLAVVGGVTALVLSAGPSIATAIDGGSSESVNEVDTVADIGAGAEPTVYFVDENGNLATADDAQQAESNPVSQAEASTGEYDDEDHAEYEEHDEHEEHDDYEDDDYEDHGEYEAHGAGDHD